MVSTFVQVGQWLIIMMLSAVTLTEGVATLDAHGLLLAHGLEVLQTSRAGKKGNLHRLLLPTNISISVMEWHDYNESDM